MMRFLLRFLVHCFWSESYCARTSIPLSRVSPMTGVREILSSSASVTSRNSRMRTRSVPPLSLKMSRFLRTCLPQRATLPP